ncbi:hypothetical protein K9L97_01975 [Candidatus Woesearchaeota archaeon]|nr:hypothetical protein [Candidatus Woesearchaeota archaeon]
MNKKAALQLGISTIVVLVIAMVLIGAGVSFIRTFFNEGENKLIGAFDIEDFGKQPTRLDPLVLEEGVLRIKSGKSTNVPVGFYNAKDSPEENVTITAGNCVPAVGVENFTIQSLPQDVTNGQKAGFTVTVFMKASEGVYVCEIKAEGLKGILETEQIEVEIMN